MKKPASNPRSEIGSAANALSDLNIFYGIIALLEGGAVHAPSHGAQERIIRICKDEGGRCLARYDRHVARAMRALDPPQRAPKRKAK